MVRWFVAGALLCFAGHAYAQSVIDGSDAGISDQRLQKTLDAVASKLRDPTSAQFRRLHSPNPDSLCGEINGKNGYGGYAGFTPFDASMINGSSNIMPREKDWLSNLRIEAYVTSGCKLYNR